jgi:hypothetical protein
VVLILAQQVGLTMLSRMTVDTMTQSLPLPLGVQQSSASMASPQPVLNLVFRDPTNASLYRIPNYEGQPMITTLCEQIGAGGATFSPANWSCAGSRSGPVRRERLCCPICMELASFNFSTVVFRHC